MKIILFLFIQASVAYNLSGYPEIDVTPPINQTLTNIFLGNVTLSPSGGDIYNYTNDITTCVDSNFWAVTYDDGPSPLTLNVLKDLKDRNITATFFVIGSMVLKHPEILIETFKAGMKSGFILGHIHPW
jgi:peptidoglycan/xylan/chitin deacetylase (PgdA/CDA1 family)